MKLQQIIENAILAEAKKHAKRHQEYHNYLDTLHKRKQRRFLPVPAKQVIVPPHWQEDDKFNPYYVIKHSSQIARSITRKIQDGTYKPNPPFEQKISKKGGGERTVCVYQIPDAAISNYLYKQLLAKNKHRFSSFSYAYRDDRNVHFAIQDIVVDLKNYPRIFISEFDFSDFFGSISHQFLFQQFQENGFFITNEEQKIIKGFLEIQDVGVPQGTSISLFLANLTCWKMDRVLEQNGLKFARYADDTIVWSNDYSKIVKSFEIINEFSKTAGVGKNVSLS